jgi:DNA-binding GntR family transcriptional regulator
MRLSEKAYGLIKRKIITLELPPLAVIDERALMDELDLGRTPIREALHRLATEQLVTIVPRRGMFVADTSITDLHKIYEVRVVLETHCARLAAERATPAQVARMEETLDELRSLGPSDADAIMAVDRRFHKSLYQCSQNEFLIEPLERLHALSLRLWYIILNQIVDVGGAVEEHRLVAEAVKQGDSDKAEALIRDQLVRFQQQIKDRL